MFLGKIAFWIYLSVYAFVILRQKKSKASQGNEKNKNFQEKK